ncbi:LOB domain-containing protein 40-like [Silene latifolia]|uniref:LOB domain-containing protein 40-like n=1 Tax=Silene latifolia TaxID=37657 RepID=UPI003D76B336
MRMSCNGCRVLRKGCNEKCMIKPCLEWIKSPESQSNATLFLAKFYGRAGLLNLINAAPDHLRPATFRSLLYESCGRMVNPIYGSVGLLWSGEWHLCQSAVESVLKGLPITPIPVEAAANPPPIKGAYDIRHVTKEETSISGDLDRSKINRARFKRSGGVIKPKAKRSSVIGLMSVRTNPGELYGSSTSHDDSSVSHPDDANSHSLMLSVETTEAGVAEREIGGGELELELTLGFPASESNNYMVGQRPCKMEL